MNIPTVSYKVSVLKNSSLIDYSLIKDEIFPTSKQANEHYNKLTNTFTYLKFKITKITTNYEVILYDD